MRTCLGNKKQVPVVKPSKSRSLRVGTNLNRSRWNIIILKAIQIIARNRIGVTKKVDNYSKVLLLCNQ